MTSSLTPLPVAWLAAEIERPMVEVADTVWPILDAILHQCQTIMPAIEGQAARSVLRDHAGREVQID